VGWPISSWISRKSWEKTRAALLTAPPREGSAMVC
jgi:hypothetical protein